MKEDGLETLAEQFAAWVWCSSAQERARRQAEFELGRQAAHAVPSEILARQADETLALAIRDDCYRAEALLELLQQRYRRLLFFWFRRWSGNDRTAEDLF